MCHNGRHLAIVDDFYSINISFRMLKWKFNDCYQISVSMMNGTSTNFCDALLQDFQKTGSRMGNTCAKIASRRMICQQNILLVMASNRSWLRGPEEILLQPQRLHMTDIQCHACVISITHIWQRMIQICLKLTSDLILDALIDTMLFGVVSCRIPSKATETDSKECRVDFLHLLPQWEKALGQGTREKPLRVADKKDA